MDIQSKVKELMSSYKSCAFRFELDPESDVVVLLVKDRGILSELTVQNLIASSIQYSGNVPASIIRARSFNQAIPFLLAQIEELKDKGIPDITVIHTNTIRDEDLAQLNYFGATDIKLVHHLDVFVEGANEESAVYRKQAEQGKRKEAKQLQQIQRKFLFPVLPDRATTFGFRCSREFRSELEKKSISYWMNVLEQHINSLQGNENETV